MPTAAALAAVLLAVAVALAVAPGDAPGDPDPSPEYGPADVVRIQVEAMQRNDDPAPDAGIATAFRFASPGNRAATGPLDRFARMVHGPTYRDLLGSERADFGAVVVDGDRAAQRVTLSHADGRTATYVFGLSRQTGGACDGCWMTDSVVRQDPDAGSTRV